MILATLEVSNSVFNNAVSQSTTYILDAIGWQTVRKESDTTYIDEGYLLTGPVESGNEALSAGKPNRHHEYLGMLQDVVAMISADEVAISGIPNSQTRLILTSEISQRCLNTGPIHSTSGLPSKAWWL